MQRVTAWEAFDSRGTPTVGCQVEVAGGGRGKAVVPSGASKGRHEAHELRDGGERYGGSGVLRAVENVEHELAASICGLPADDQRGIDDALRAADGTANLGRLGANAVLAVSIACALAAADEYDEPLYRVVFGAGTPILPLPMVNILSGGVHAGWAVDIQDVLAVPVGAASLRQGLEWVWRVRKAAAEILAARGIQVALVADEGGLGPPLPSNRAAFELVVDAVERAGLSPGDEVALAVDVAATQFLGPDGYTLSADGATYSAHELVAQISGWANEFPIVSIEDPLGEDDWDGWTIASRQLTGLQLLGDDLVATDIARLRCAAQRAVANAVLVKPNQTGTLSSAHLVVEEADRLGYATVLSARSGDTEDSWLADLAVAWPARQIKVGSTTRAERTAKWNRLLQIEAELGSNAEYAGGLALASAHGGAGAGGSTRPRAEGSLD